MSGTGGRFRRAADERSGLRWRAADPQRDHARHATRHQRSQGEGDMPTEIKMGQNWSAWVPARRQWLLATVISQENGRTTLKYDSRYGVEQGQDEVQTDDVTLLGTPNLFRFVES